MVATQRTLGEHFRKKRTELFLSMTQPTKLLGLAITILPPKNRRRTTTARLNLIGN